MIRTANMDDLIAVTEIYNQAIAAGFQTAFTSLFVAADRREWLEQHMRPGYPVLVYEQYGVVAGWASISPYRDGRDALKQCVEISYFVHNAYLRQGIGKALVQQALKVCRLAGHKSVIAIVIDVNIPSINLLIGEGFAEWGHLPGIATFGGVVCGQVYYGLHL